MLLKPLTNVLESAQRWLRASKQWQKVKLVTPTQLTNSALDYNQDVVSANLALVLKGRILARAAAASRRKKFISFLEKQPKQERRF